MSGSPLSPQEIRAAAAYAELGPEYSDARLPGMGQPEPPTGLGHRRNLLKRVGVGMAVSGIAVLVVGGSPGERLPGLWVLALVVVCAAGADWAGQARVVRPGPLVGQG